ncbi:MAG: stage II sporulation protein R [Clostridia bacterium]|nr:stage II sporulation protein R [Clostridia bacterium]
MSHKILKLSNTKVKTAVKSVAVAFVLCFLLSMTDFDARSKDIADSVVRFHIIANSDNEGDQQLKLKIRDEVLNVCRNIYPEECTKQQAEAILSQHMSDIVNTAQNVAAQYGYDYDISGELVNMFFPNRVYDDFTLPAGYYDAVRLKIGSGKGHNWWCVMFPPVCIAAAECDISDVLSDSQLDLVKSDGISYRFKIYEWFEKTTVGSVG